MLGVEEIAWIDPTLLFAIVAFFLLRGTGLRKPGVVLVMFAFVSASIGSLFVVTRSVGGHNELYSIYREPIRLALNFVWFWVMIRLFTTERQLIIKWLAVTVLAEETIAAYFYLALFDLVPLPDVLGAYLKFYGARQTIDFGGLVIPRMGGTFFEAPPFGLFMFSCFIIFALEWLRSGKGDGNNGKWYRLGFAVSLLGAVWSLSFEVLAALMVFIVAYYYYQQRKSAIRRLSAVTVVVILAFGGPYLAYGLGKKLTGEAKEGSDVYGQSVRERAFHVAYAASVLGEKPGALFTGVGPGRYGEYAARTGIFPNTVVPGTSFTEWIVGYGVLGATLILFLLLRVSGNAKHRFGRLGSVATIAVVIADMFQSNWLWEGWFLCLAYLYAAGCFVQRAEVRVVSDASSGPISA